MNEKIIKWGFIGCGEVTKYKSGPAFQKIEHSEVVAVMSRDISKAKAYAKERGIAKWYNDALTKINAMAAPFVNNIKDPSAGEAIKACQDLDAILSDVKTALRNN